MERADSHRLCMSKTTQSSFWRRGAAHRPALRLAHGAHRAGADLGRRSGDRRPFEGALGVHAACLLCDWDVRVALPRLLIPCVASMVDNQPIDAGGEQRGDGLHPRELPRQQRLGLDPRLVRVGERHVWGAGDAVAGGAAPLVAARRCVSVLLRGVDRWMYRRVGKRNRKTDCVYVCANSGPNRQ